MKQMIQANLNPKFEIEEKAANRWHVHVIHKLFDKQTFTINEFEDVICMQTLVEFNQFEQHKPKSIKYSQLIHDPIKWAKDNKAANVAANDDLAKGVGVKNVPDDMAQVKRVRKLNKN